MMEYDLPFLDDDFLSELKGNFYTDLLEKYKDLAPVDTVKLNVADIFRAPNVKESDIKFTYEPLLFDNEEEDTKFASENVKRLHGSLKNLSTSQAAMEKIWVALLNTYYIDYHLHIIRQLQGKVDANQQIWDRTFLSGRNGDKRQQMMNNLSSLWWIGHYTYDKDNFSNPYHLTEFFMSTPYRGNSLVFFSSNIHGNKIITLGILDGIKQLVDDNVIAINRYAYSNSSKIINTVAGVKLVDLMSREDIKNIIIEELPKTDSITLL